MINIITGVNWRDRFTAGNIYFWLFNGVVSVIGQEFTICRPKYGTFKHLEADSFKNESFTESADNSFPC